MRKKSEEAIPELGVASFICPCALMQIPTRCPPANVASDWWAGSNRRRSKLRFRAHFVSADAKTKKELASPPPAVRQLLSMPLVNQTPPILRLASLAQGGGVLKTTNELAALIPASG